MIIDIIIANAEKLNATYFPLPFFKIRSIINPINANGYKTIIYNPPLFDVISETNNMHKEHIKDNKIIFALCLHIKSYFFSLNVL